MPKRARSPKAKPPDPVDPALTPALTFADLVDAMQQRHNLPLTSHSSRKRHNDAKRNRIR
jgi:hypothetical protein